MQSNYALKYRLTLNSFVLEVCGLLGPLDTPVRVRREDRRALRQLSLTREWSRGLNTLLKSRIRHIQRVPTEMKLLLFGEGVRSGFKIQRHLLPFLKRRLTQLFPSKVSGSIPGATEGDTPVVG